MKLKYLLLFCSSFLLNNTWAQMGSNATPTEIFTGTFIGETVPLRDWPKVDVSRQQKGPATMRIVPNNMRRNAKVNQTALPMGSDPLRQSQLGKLRAFELEQNFDGLSRAEAGGYTPADPTGAAGPNHYIASVNVAIKIFDKTGNLLAGPTDLASFLGVANNNGDPILLYDQLADRFFVSQLDVLANTIVIGVSTTPDPTGSYNVYEFVFDAFPDYPHFSVWPDGYYLTVNKEGTNKVYALERDEMLAGSASPQVVGFPLPGIIENANTVLSPEPANLLGTSFPTMVPGYIVYLQDDGWDGVLFDHLKVWEITMDWTTVSNSTISMPMEIPTAPFDSVFGPFGLGDVAQPVTNQKIDMIGGVISFAANYRSFGTHNAWLITFNTDVDGNDTSGIRWIELRDDAINPWTIFQEGTYAPADGHSRFMGSAAMDGFGNIGLGFNIASASLPVGIRFTGRYDGDPLGQMTVAETPIVDGIGVQTISNRFGDYSHLTLDPDNFTFWHTAEYFPTDNEWASRVASFKLAGGFNNDIGVNAILSPTNGVLTNAEEVTVSVRNYGALDQSNFMIELRQDGILVASESFTGTVGAGTVENFTFAQTVDLSTLGATYNLEAKTVLTNDAYTLNDAFTKDVRFLFTNDLGVTEVLAPLTGSGLDQETISVRVKNFGSDVQSGFDLAYELDGNTSVIETFAPAIASEEEVVFQFTTEGDFSTLGNHDLRVLTQLPNDADGTNDAVEVQIENILCMPTSVCFLGNGIQGFKLAEIDNLTACEGYADYRNLVASLGLDTSNELTISTGWGNQYVSVWIDFDDNSIFTSNELVVDNFVIAPGQGQGNYTASTQLVIAPDALTGSHLMRAKSNYDGPVPADACEPGLFSDTEDYTVTIGSLSTIDHQINQSELVVTNLKNKQFDVEFNTLLDGPVYVAIYNSLGQQLKFMTVQKDEDAFRVKLDMSMAQNGVYYIRMGSPQAMTYAASKIIVKD